MRASPLPEPHLVNPPPLRPVLGLVVRPRRIGGTGDAGLGLEEFGDERRGLLEVLAVIGDVDAAAAGSERPPHLRERLGADDAAFPLALPRPRVGTVDM